MPSSTDCVLQGRLNSVTTDRYVDRELSCCLNDLLKLKRHQIVSHVSMLVITLPQERIDYDASPGPLQRESFDPERHSNDGCPIARRAVNRTRTRVASNARIQRRTEARVTRSMVCNFALHSNRLLILLQRRDLNTSPTAPVVGRTRLILPRRAKERRTK